MKPDKIKIFLFHILCLYEYINSKNFIEEVNEIKNNNVILDNSADPSSYILLMALKL